MKYMFFSCCFSHFPKNEFLLQALESTSTLIIEFRDNEEKAAWLKELVQAIYRASVLLLLSLFNCLVFSIITITTIPWCSFVYCSPFPGQAPLTMDILGDEVDGPLDSVAPYDSSLRTADLVINGSLVEMKLSIYGKVICCGFLVYWSLTIC